MIAVAVSGAAGRMGRLACTAVDEASDLELVARFDPAGRDGAASDPAELAGAAVIVEFGPPSPVLENLERWRALGADCVVGTSGFSPDRIEQVERLFGPGPRNCLIVPNFSLGAVLMMQLAGQAAEHFKASEIIELHHDGKADAPSGTALATAGILAHGDQRRDVESAESVAGARGARVAGVPVHSVRLPGLMAHQQVIFGNPGETLTIRHDSTDRVAYVPGILLAIRGVAGLGGGVHVGLESVI